MKKRIIALSLAILVSQVFLTPAFSKHEHNHVSTHKEAKISKVEHYFTANGIEVILKKIDTNDIIGFTVFVKGGSRNITSKNEGIEKLLLNTMLQGSKSFSKDKLNGEMAKLGANIGADTFFDYSKLYLKSLNKYFDKSLNMFQSVINEPLLDKKEIDLQKNKMKAQIKHGMDDPDTYVWKLINKKYLQGHPYENDYAGNLATLDNITQEDLKNHLKTNFIGSKLMIVVSGNYKSSIKKDIEKYFGKLPKGNYVETKVPAIVKTEPSISIDDRDIPTAYIAGRFSIPNIGEKDYPATYLGLKILSEKLHETIRTKHALSYAVYSGASLRTANSGYVYVTTIKPKESMDLMFQEIEKMKTSLVDKNYLNGVINLYYTGYFINIEPVLEQADNLGVSQLISKDYNNGYKLIEEFKKVTPEQIKEAMNKYLKNINFGVIYKKSGIDEKDFLKM